MSRTDTREITADDLTSYRRVTICAHQPVKIPAAERRSENAINIH